MARIDLDNLPPAARNEAERQLDLLARGAVEIYTKDELLAKLAASVHQGRPLRVKLGMDPTAPDIHIGHTVVMGKMRQFQDLGHKAVLIIGDYTARIGDPSGEDHTRPVLTEDRIRENAETYFEQAGKVLDTSPERLEIRHNSEWLEKLTFADMLRLASHTTVAQILERDSFQKRYKAGEPIGVHEFLYPLMQAHDSVATRADVELGGTDQTFNCLVGRTLTSLAGYQLMAQAQAQVVLTMPLLVGLDGTEKMSKSKGNYIGVTDEPDEMFGKLMSLPDRLMENYFTLLTDTPLPEIQELLQRSHPRDAKEQLAKTIVTRYHGDEAARTSAQDFRRKFSLRQRPLNIAVSDISTDILDPPGTHGPATASTVWLPKLMVETGCASSNSDAMRKIGQTPFVINEDLYTDPKAHPQIKDGDIVHWGRRYWWQIHIAPDE